MKKTAIAFALALTLSALNAPAQDDAAGGPPPPPKGGPKAGGPGPGRPGFRVHVLPPGAGAALELTDAQKKQIARLEAETQAKLEKILTPEQLDKLKQLRPPPPPGGGPGPDAGPPGGPGGKPAAKPSASPSGADSPDAAATQ